MKSNIRVFPTRTTPKPAKVRLSDADREKLFQATQGMHVHFDELATGPAPTSADAAGDNRLAMGPYNQPIRYEGQVEHHLAGQWIDKLRAMRQYTSNSVEMRCDALGLVVYMAGVTQVNPDSDDKHLLHRVRVAVYDFKNMKPTKLFYAASSDELTTLLVSTLANTYNRLAQQYNLAGLNLGKVMLKSPHPSFPDIPLLTSLVTYEKANQ